MFQLLLIASIDICDLYLFHSISLANPDFKLVNSLISSSLDKVTTGIYNLQSFIASVAPVGAPSLFAPTNLCSKLVITQFLFHFNSKDTSQLINGIFNALQKLPKYFNGIANSIFDELSNDDDDDDNFANIKVVTLKTFKYKNKIIGNTYNIAAAAAADYDTNKEDPIVFL